MPLKRILKEIIFLIFIRQVSSRENRINSVDNSDLSQRTRESLLNYSSIEFIKFANFKFKKKTLSVSFKDFDPKHNNFDLYVSIENNSTHKFFKYLLNMPNKSLSLS